ncbi:MAG: hypothetical protein Sapg2KO_30140 [Saprospiraceae bacterium]
MNLSLGPGVVLTMLILFAGVSTFTFLKARHIERMAQIEKGLDINQPNSNFFEIKFGLLFAGTGFGLLFAFFITKMTSISNDAVLFPAFMLFFGGLGLLSSYFIANRLGDH